MAKSKTRLVADYLSQIDTDPDTGEVISSSDYTDSAISGLISSAPDALNTLDELAAAINDDAGYYTTITNTLATKYESGDDVSLGSATFTGDVLLNEATPFLRLQENSAGAKRLDLSVNSSAQAKIEANQSASTMIFNVSSSEALRLNYNANGAVFNEGGVDRDFRVESDTKSHALFVNGSDGYVGINRDSPAYQLHVNGNFYATTMRSGQFAEYYLSYGSGGGVHFIGQLRPTNYTDGYAHIRLDSSIDHGQGMPGTLEVVVKQRSGNYYGYAWRTGSPQNNNDSRVKLVSTDGGATIDVYLEVDDYLTGAISVTYRSGGSWTSAQSAGSFLESDVIWNSDEHLNSVENDGYMQINPSARDFDFYVATDNNGSTLYVNGQNDYVATGGTGTVTTEGSLRVHAKGSNNLNILRSYDQGTGLILSCTNNGGKDALISAMRGGQNLRIESAGTTTLGVGGDIFIYGENGNNDAVNLRFGSDDSVGATTNDRAQIQYYASNNNTGNLYFYTKKDAGSLYQTQAMYGNGGVVINEDSAAHIDFRVESDSNTHMLFVDAGTGRVAVNTDTPYAALDVVGDIAARGAYANKLTGAQLSTYNGGVTNPFTAAELCFNSGGKTGWGPDDSLGRLVWHTRDGSGAGQRDIAMIESTCRSGNHDSTTTMSAGLDFHTSPYNGNTTLRTRITETGWFTHYEGAVFNENGSGNDFRVESDGNTHMLFVDASANGVGIGTSAVNGQLHVKSTGLTGVVIEGNQTTDTVIGRTSYVNTAASDTVATVGVVRDGADDAGAFYVQTQNAGGGNTERFRIDSKGQAGLGVIPNADWHSSYVDVFQIGGVGAALWAANSNYSANNYMWMTDNAYYDGTNMLYARTTPGGTSQFRQGSGEQVFFYAPAGTIDTAISYKQTLKLNASGATFNEDSQNYDFRVESDGHTHALFVDASDNTVRIGRSNNDLSTLGCMFGTAGWGTIRGTITNNELFTFDNYNGSGFYQVDFRWNNSEVGSISVTSSGATYNTTSDRRLKENIEAITDGTDKLMAMRPVTHTWIADKDAPAVHGFIAQEMQEIVPEAVSGDPEGEEMMSMDYGRITPVLVAALQDAHRKIAELESRLSAMEAK